MNKCTLAHLEMSALISFIEVAERGSFTEAATILNLSQPTVSQQIRRLEKFIGTQLLHRRSNKVYLSQAGEALISHCRIALRELEAGVASALQEAQAIEEKVTLGITCHNAQRCLSQALKLYHQQNPHVHLQIFEGLPDDLVRGLQKKTMDLAILSLPVPVEEFRFESLYEEPLSLITSSTHPLASITNITWKDIHPYPLILPAQKSVFGIRSLIEELYGIRKRKLSNIIEVSGSQPLRQLLLSNYGIAFLPPSQFQKDLEEGLLVIKKSLEFSLTHKVTIAIHAQSSLSLAAQKLIEIMKISR